MNLLALGLQQRDHSEADADVEREISEEITTRSSSRVRDGRITQLHRGSVCTNARLSTEERGVQTRSGGASVSTIGSRKK